jgi:hypothetical protein
VSETSPGAPLQVPQLGQVAQGLRAADRNQSAGAVAEVWIPPGQPGRVPDARIGEPAGAAAEEARHLPEPGAALQARVRPRPRGVSDRSALGTSAFVRRSR